MRKLLFSALLACLLSACSSLLEETQVNPAATSGLLGQYYDEANFKEAEPSGEPALTRIDAQVNFDWGDGSPGGLGEDTFMVVWEGKVVAPESSTYTFVVRSDDGVTLEVGGETLFDDWQDRAVKESSGSVQLEANQSYPLKLSYYENRGLAEVQLLWAREGQEPEVIPSAQLQPTQEGDDGAAPNPSAPSGAAAALNIPRSQLLPTGTTSYRFEVTTAEAADVRAEVADVPFGEMTYRGAAQEGGTRHTFDVPVSTNAPLSLHIRALSQQTGETLGDAQQLNVRVLPSYDPGYPRLFTLWWPQWGSWEEATAEKLSDLAGFIVNLHDYHTPEGFQPIDPALFRTAQENDTKILTQLYSTYGCAASAGMCDALTEADAAGPLAGQVYVRNTDGSVWLYGNGGGHPVYNFANPETVDFLVERNLELWRSDLLTFDGAFVDNCWRGFTGVYPPGSADAIDLDLDGQADDALERDTAYERGLQRFLTKLRAGMPHATLLCNSVSGQPDQQAQHDEGKPLLGVDGEPFSYADVIDGVEFEDELALLGEGEYWRTFAEFMAQYAAWDEATPAGLNLVPSKVVADGSPDDSAAYADPRALRFGLAAALMGDGLFLHGGWGYYTWFGEYEVALGEPLADFGAPIGEDSPVWRRDFEQGVALVHSGDEAVSVDLGDAYQLPSGETGTSVTLGPLDGRVLLRAP